MKRIVLSCLVLGMCGCTGAFHANLWSSGNTTLKTPLPTTPPSGNQWNAISMAGSTCSGTYQVSVSGTPMIMTVFADQTGSFSGIAAIDGQANQSVTGSCSNGKISFSIAGQKYSGNYSQ